MRGIGESSVMIVVVMALETFEIRVVRGAVGSSMRLIVEDDNFINAEDGESTGDGTG